MTGILLRVEYDGTGFCGWQRQPTGVSIQQSIEEALARLHGGLHIGVTATGRTDAGVHARAQGVSFRTEHPRSLDAYTRGLNTLLPPAIAVREAQEVPPDFCARRWARGKRYVYRLYVSRTPSPLREGQVWRLYRPLHVDAMREAAQILVGTHDFGAFRASDCESRGAVRTLWRCAVDTVADEVVVSIEGEAFLKNMCRNIVGTLVDVGHGKTSVEQMRLILASRDRTRAGRTAPAQGLCLDEVFYDLDSGPPTADRQDDDDA